VWFTACWLFATGKDGISALSLKRTLEIGYYREARIVVRREAGEVVAEHMLQGVGAQLGVGRPRRDRGYRRRQHRLA
jgi:hypothetical protein